jgi:hypothetical protein
MCDLAQERINADLYELDFMMCGNMAFAVSYQEQALGRGLSLHVFESSSTYREIIRFDCFENKPHYHLNYSDYDYPSIEIPGRNITETLSWACSAMLVNTEELLVKSRAKNLMKTIDFELMQEVLLDIKKLARQLIEEHDLPNTKNQASPCV